MSDTELGTHPCDGCGQVDDHPMVHIAFGSWQKDDRTFITEPSFHFDCLPEQFRADLNETAQATVAAAEAGTHGAELRDFIASQHPDTAQEG